MAVATGSYDGTFGLQHDSGFKAVRIEIEKFSHIIFSGKPTDRQFWLGKGRHNVDELSDIYGGPKPCLHGSDAHEENRLFRPDHDRFCWIKADPTFDGLRQTLFEPDERVFIGIERPERHNSDSVISDLKIGNTCGWFSTDTIRLNPGFVAIIGSKGSGKTALADLIAAAAGAEVDQEDSFLSRARDHLAGLNADLQWVSGRVSNLSLPLDDELWSYQADVHYLSQKFVEKLCAGNDIGEALKAEIERVVFGHLPDDKTMNASSFRELRDELTGGLRERRVEIRGEISTLNQEISRIDREETQNPIKQRRIVELGKQLGELKKQYPKIEDANTKKVLSALEKARQEQQKLTESVAKLRSKQQTLDNVERRVKQFAMSQEEFWTKIQEEFRLLGMSPKDIEAFQPAFRGNTILPIENLRVTLKDQITQMIGHGATGDPVPESVVHPKSETES